MKLTATDFDHARAGGNEKAHIGVIGFVKIAVAPQPA